MKSLKQWFEECPEALVAFSGGVDSSLVAYLARHYMPREKVTAVISDSPSLKRSELNAARLYCETHDIPLKVIRTREMDDPNYLLNPINRCFFCKQALYQDLLELRKSRNGAWILNGHNTDDHGDYRPGTEAAEQSGVRSPLSDCGLNKEAVRDLANHYNLECWDKPASPCLSSRIPYGENVTEDKLRRIEEAEKILNLHGYPVVRVRHKGNSAWVEVPIDRVRELASNWPPIRIELLRLGFESALIDNEGFISGKLNRAIK